MTKAIQAAVANTLKIMKVRATVEVTPSFIAIENIQTEVEAKLIENTFVKQGFLSLGVCNLRELEMGNGFCLTLKF